MHTYHRIAAGAACVLLSMPAMAENPRHAAAHIHGEGELNFAVEGNFLHLELSTPGFDILGFESITTEAQHEQLDEALEKLKSTTLWQLTPAADCNLIEVSTSNNYPSHDDDQHDHGSDHDDSHDDDQHDHGSDHDDSHEEHEKHKGHHNEHNDGDHIDISATYVYQCSEIGNLNSIVTTLFNTFPHSEQLRVQGFTASGQLAEHMNRDKPEVQF